MYKCPYSIFKCSSVWRKLAIVNAKMFIVQSVCHSIITFEIYQDICFPRVLANTLHKHYILIN